eukprot:6213368-Pleurochrysis_carterae.AAC.1
MSDGGLEAETQKERERDAEKERQTHRRRAHHPVILDRCCQFGRASAERQTCHAPWLQRTIL